MRFNHLHNFIPKKYTYKNTYTFYFVLILPSRQILHSQPKLQHLVTRRAAKTHAHPGKVRARREIFHGPAGASYKFVLGARRCSPRGIGKTDVQRSREWCTRLVNSLAFGCRITLVLMQSEFGSVRQICTGVVFCARWTPALCLADICRGGGMFGFVDKILRFAYVCVVLWWIAIGLGVWLL